MSGTIREAKLQTITARQRLKRGRQPHWRTIIPGRAALGYQRRPGGADGRWLLRRYANGNYSIEPLGRADDGDGDGLTYDKAFACAQSKLGAAVVPTKLTVRKAMALYIEYLESQGKATRDVIYRSALHILPTLGNTLVSELTSRTIRNWLVELARSPAKLRGANVRVHDKNDEEALRARRASANRVLSMLKAALNHCYDEKLINDTSAWGRRVKPLRDASAARIRYLTIDEAQRLLNVCEPDLRSLVRGALETGCRLSELVRVRCEDFNIDSGTIHVRKSKSGKERHVILSQDGVSFFKSIIVGRNRTAWIFGDGRSSLDTRNINRPLQRANAVARIDPPASFHILRHTWASLATMNNVPLMVVSQNLGHSSILMTQKHYAHLAPSYAADAIRAGAPRFGIVDSNVEPLRARRS